MVKKKNWQIEAKSHRKAHLKNIVIYYGLTTFFYHSAALMITI